MTQKKKSEEGLLKAIGDCLRDRRQVLGISQKQLAELSGLHQTYVSDLERGTRNLSVLSLVQIASALDMTLSELTALAEKSLEPVSNALQILLVEDNLADVHLIQMAMKRGRFPSNVHVVEDGSNAMQFLRKIGKYKTAVTPDLVILDFNLPRKSGGEVLAEMKADHRLRKIPVVVLSTSAASDDIMKAYDLHGSSFITKPVNPDEFFKTMASIQEYWFHVASLPAGAS